LHSDTAAGPSDASLDAGVSDAGTAEVGTPLAASTEPRPLGSRIVKATTALGSSMPNLYVGYAELSRVSIRPVEEADASGSAQIEFSTCEQCEVSIDTLRVAESSVRNSRLSAGRLDVVGGALDTVELSFDYGLLAGLVGSDIRTARCKTLSLVGSTIAGRASQIGPCDCGRPTEAAGDADPLDAGRAEAGRAEAG